MEDELYCCVIKSDTKLTEEELASQDADKESYERSVRLAQENADNFVWENFKL